VQWLVDTAELLNWQVTLTILHKLLHLLLDQNGDQLLLLIWQVVLQVVDLLEQLQLLLQHKWVLLLASDLLFVHFGLELDQVALDDVDQLAQESEVLHVLLLLEVSSSEQLLVLLPKVLQISNVLIQLLLSDHNHLDVIDNHAQWQDLLDDSALEFVQQLLEFVLLNCHIHLLHALQLNLQISNLLPQFLLATTSSWHDLHCLQDLSERLDSHLNDLLQLTNQFLDQLSLLAASGKSLCDCPCCWESLMEFNQTALQLSQLIQKEFASRFLNEVLDFAWKSLQEVDVLAQLVQHLLNVNSLDWHLTAHINVVVVGQLESQAGLKLLQLLDQLSVPFLTIDIESHLLECLLDGVQFQLTLELDDLLLQLLDLLLVEESLCLEFWFAQDGHGLSWHDVLAWISATIELLLQLLALDLIDLILDFVNHSLQVLLGLSHLLLLASLLLDEVVLQISQQVLQVDLSLLANGVVLNLLLELDQLFLELLVMTIQELILVLLVLSQLLLALSQSLLHVLHDSLSLLILQVQSLSQQALESSDLVFVVLLLLLGQFSCVSDGLQLLAKLSHLLLDVLLIVLSLLDLSLLLLVQLTLARLDLRLDHQLLSLSVLLLSLLLLNQFALNVLVQLLFPILLCARELNVFPVQCCLSWKLLLQILQAQFQVLQTLLQILQTLLHTVLLSIPLLFVVDLGQIDLSWANSGGLNTSWHNGLDASWAHSGGGGGCLKTSCCWHTSLDFPLLLLDPLVWLGAHAFELLLNVGDSLLVLSELSDQRLQCWLLALPLALTLLLLDSLDLLTDLLLLSDILDAVDSLWLLLLANATSLLEGEWLRSSTH